MKVYVAGCGKFSALSVGCPTKMYKSEQFQKVTSSGRARGDCL